jgi:DnaK suppressor protein
MTKEEHLLIINIIQSEQEKLKKKVIELKELTGSVTPDDAIGRVSRMDAINNNSIVKASITNLENRLDLLEMAIRMSDNPDFGTCTVCHQPIPFERLKLRPEISLCAGCIRK